MVSDILSSFYVYQTELQIRAPFKGIVQRIVTNGKSLDENEVIAELEELWSDYFLDLKMREALEVQGRLCGGITILFLFCFFVVRVSCRKI